MALQLTLDAALKTLSEPGFWRFVPTRQVAESGNPSNEASHQGIWFDEPTSTLMLKPLQLDPSWLNTPAQVGSIIRLSQMTVNSADTLASAIFESPAFGNADNPFIFHVPVGPSGAFPGAPRPTVPGGAPSLVGVAVPQDPSLTEILVQSPTVVYQPDVTMPASPPTVTPIGSTADGKFLAQTTRLAANQGLYFRWFQPASMLGFPCIYEFYAGQFKLRIKDVTVEVFQDISANGDRSAWQKVMIAPLFSVGSLSPPGTGSLVAVVRPESVLAHDRALLWLPFRHNQVLLYSSASKWAVLTVNGSPKRLPDNSDWDIVRADTLLVWVMTPAPGRFQVQTLTYPPGAIQVQSPTVTIDYTPSVSPTITLNTDTDHGTSLTATQTQPPSYSIPTNSASDCPPMTTTTSDQRRTYGVELSLAASGDQKWTPFFYGYQIATPRVFATPGTTPKTISDASSISSPVPVVQHARLTAGLDPGQGRATIEVVDPAPAYALANYYYRQAMQIQLVDSDGPSTIFTGITAPNEVTPITAASSSPRRITVSAVDRWKQLADTYLRDQTDWTGCGHIDVVNFIAQQAGIDTTGAEYPAGYTPVSPPALTHVSALNSPLGGAGVTLAQSSGDVKSGWKPRDDDTAASYILRIQNLYSAWYCGFRLDGTFFYLPREYFVTPAVTFQATNSGGSPRFLGAPTFTTQEPEANVILVKAANSVNGAVAYSSLWVDWQSIQNPSAVNYLGRWRAEVVQIGGTFSCAQLNWIARTIWFQTRRRYLNVRFEAEFVPTLKVGQVCTLGTYGNYRITGMDIDIKHEGVHRCHYTGYLLENGF